MSLKAELTQYINAGFPIILINSFEERKVDLMIQEAASDFTLYEWNALNGLCDFRTKAPFQMMDQSLASTLRFLLQERELDNVVLVLRNVAVWDDDPEVTALLAMAAGKASVGELGCTVVIEAYDARIPDELGVYTTILEMDYLGTDNIKKVICDFASDNGFDRLPSGFLHEIAIAFKGLSQFEIENILALAYTRSGKIQREDLKLIFEQKRQMILKSGILEMIPLKESMEDIGGLENLKKWLRRKAAVLKDVEKAAAFGVDMPKGLLVAGVPGCGKSLNAKAAASLFQIPLLRMDMGRLMGKYVGESEANMRKAIRLAEAISPCVLWVDELEKAFSGIGNSDGGADVTTRLFGNFLTWMQEKESAVFVVATANDISKLPPELMRKGRFDEIFYVGLPNREERKKIFEIHIGKRRKQDLGGISVDKLVDSTDGYSGADIEGVVRESIEKAYAEGRGKLCMEDITEVIRNTHSLKELLGDSLKNMKDVYEKGNFKNASAE